MKLLMSGIVNTLFLYFSKNGPENLFFFTKMFFSPSEVLFQKLKKIK